MEGERIKGDVLGLGGGGEVGGLELVMAETRGAARAQQGCTLHLSVQPSHCIMYHFLLYGRTKLASCAERG